MYTYQSFESGQMHLWEARGDAEVYKKRDSHCHKECEIYFMIDGEAEIVIEGHKFFVVSDSLLLIPSNYFHQWRLPPGKVHHRVSIHFLPELLYKTEQNFFMDMFSTPLHFLNGSSYNLNFFIQSIIECAKMESPLQKIASRIRTVALLSQMYFLRYTHTIEPVVLDERIQKVIKYIGEHLPEEITLDKIARTFAISKNHMNSLFHKIVGTPMMKFISAKRLEYARREILHGVPVTEAAYRVGFNNYTTFYRAWKSFYGSPPSELLMHHIESLPKH